MARGRMVVTTVAIDKRLNALSLESQLLFLMTVPHLDRDGLIAGDAELLAGRVIPRRTELHARVNDLVQEWIDSGLAISYDGPDTLILFFPGFRKSQLKMQYDREGASEFPPPPGYIRTASGLDPEPDKPTLAEVKSNARPPLDEITVKLTEEKIEVEEKGKRRQGAPAPFPAQASASSGREQVERLKRMNAQVSPELRTPIANVVLDMTGKRALADSGTTAGDRLVDEAHEAAIALYRTGYKTESQVLALEPAWAQDWRGKHGGSFKQFVEFASERLSGKNGNGKASPGREPVGIQAMRIVMAEQEAAHAAEGGQ